MESLCQNCHVFYGHLDGLCSGCYQKLKLTTQADQTVSDLLNQLNLDISTAGNSPTHSEQAKQPPTNCYWCKRKLGPVNFKCECGGFYCARHRLPEQHECSVDYTRKGKEKLRRENPKVCSEKFTRI